MLNVIFLILSHQTNIFMDIIVLEKYYFNIGGFII